jgi:hypothetical protein
MLVYVSFHVFVEMLMHNLAVDMCMFMNQVRSKEKFIIV